jgi:hypothetical protein
MVRDSLNNISCGASRHFRDKKKEYLKDKINEFATNSKDKNIRDLYRGINGCKRGCQHRSNLVKDDTGDMFSDFHSILNRWKNCFSQLLNVHIVCDVRHAAEQLVPDPSTSEIEIAIAKLEKYKSPGYNQHPAEIIQAEGET